jgi:hypothetical protein
MTTRHIGLTLQWMAALLARRHRGVYNLPDSEGHETCAMAI